MAGKLQVTLVRSYVGQRAAPRATLRSLKLRKIRDQAELDDTPVIRGMLHRVAHLVRVEQEATSEA